MSVDNVPQNTRLGWRTRINPTRLNRETPVVQFIVLVAIVAYGVTTLDGFDSTTSLKSMLVIASFLGVASVGESILVLLGYFDLSIAGFIGLGNVLTAILVGQDHWAFIPAIVVIIALSMVLGGLSGLICHFFRVPSLVVTLGVNFILLGAIAVLTRHAITGQAPAWLTQFTSVAGSVAGVKIPPVVVLWLVVAVTAGVILRHTVIGRRTYLTGASPRAAELALVRTRRIVVGRLLSARSRRRSPASCSPGSVGRETRVSATPTCSPASPRSSWVGRRSSAVAAAIGIRSSGRSCSR